MEGSASREYDVELTQEIFEQLLDWLDRDRNRAGVRYEKIRFQLIKIFMSRGCPVPEELADKTINRVARRLNDIAGTYTGDPAPYFYGVAKMVYLEYLRKKPDLPSLPSVQATGYDEEKCECLRQCIAQLTPKNQELIMAYYGEGAKVNADKRKKIAEQMGMEPNALWVRAHRIRERLRECVSECLKNKRAY
jgi:DNA-directed RNA polymerase specialized sigma24 family protein